MTNEKKEESKPSLFETYSKLLEDEHHKLFLNVQKGEGEIAKLKAYRAESKDRTERNLISLWIRFVSNMLGDHYGYYLTLEAICLTLQEIDAVRKQLEVKGMVEPNRSLDQKVQDGIKAIDDHIAKRFDQLFSDKGEDFHYIT